MVVVGAVTVERHEDVPRVDRAHGKDVCPTHEPRHCVGLVDHAARCWAATARTLIGTLRTAPEKGTPPMNPAKAIVEELIRRQEAGVETVLEDLVAVDFV